MALAAGSRLGPYEIESPVGAGGMGEVYRALDTRLAREVAIKVLPAGVTDPERLARFEQEARAAAALNHPNILAVFDLGTHDGAPYIVMELLEGETLRERLAAGPIPIRKAIDYAVQVAHGLAAAHEKGIVHRDVKPENVFVTSDDRVKILDFGLAKLTQVEGALSSASMMVTGVRQTSPGMLMGTVAYMSPEQVRGTPADARSDIFALGALLYEMIIGRVAFQRETTAETVTAILRDEPADLAALGKPGLERLIRRCLEKNPAARFQSALDLGFALESLATASDSGAVTLPRIAHTRERIAWAVAALAIAAAAATAFTYRRAPTAPAAAMSFNVLPPPGFHIDPGQTAQTLSVSPDGRSLTFVARDDQGRAQIWIRPLTSIEARAIAGTEGARSVFWSPDGRWLGFFAEDKLKKVDIAGGVATTLCDAPTGTSAAWGAGDVIVFSQLSPFSQGGTEPGAPGLWQVSAAGGAPAAITTVGPGERGHSRPYFLPDGRHFLYSAGNATPTPEASRTVYLAEIGRPDRIKLFTTDSLVVAYDAGYLLFLRGTALVAQPFDAERGVLSGEPVQVAGAIGVGATAGGNRFGLFFASGDVLAFQTSAEVAVHQLAWFDRSGRQLSLVGERASYQSIEMLPGGLRAAMAVVDPARRTRDIWTFDLARNVRTRFTFDPTEERSAIGSPDGQFIVFSSSRSGALELYRKPAGGGEDELLFKDGQSKDPMDWSPDGRYLVYRVTGQSSSNDIMVLPLGGEKKPFPLVATQYDENYGRLSPDGRWLAYTSDESGQYEIYVTSFPSASGKWQISTNGGAFPRWRGDGRELYYVAPGNLELTAVSVNASAGSVTAEQPQALFKINPPNEPGYAYAVTRDGQRFLVNTNLAPPNPLTVIVHWTSALNK